MKTLATRCMLCFLALFLAVLAAGCYYPDYPKVVSKLSDENYAYGKQVDDLKRQLADKDATIAHDQKIMAEHQPRVETLSADRLAKLFTVGHVEIRPATDATTIGSSTQNGFRIAVRTTMLDGSILPASGTLTIEAFDLDTKAGDPRLGSWTFTPEQMKTSWYDGFGLYHFAFDCPWTRRPEHSSITFKVHFVEALTGQTFVDQKTLTVQLRTPETAPATQPELTPATTQAG